MSRIMIISSWSAPSTTVTSCDASLPTPAKISSYIRATRAGVSRSPPRSGSSPIPSRISRTPSSIFFASKPSGRSRSIRRMLPGDQRVEGRRERREVRQLAGARQVARLAEPVDPDAGQSELRARLHVVVQRGGHVHVPLAVGHRLAEEQVPVREVGLVGAGL